jgi:hypothetical protein
VTATTLEDLRKQLREKFPAAHALAVVPKTAKAIESPFAIETFPAGAISELLPCTDGGGLALWLAGVLGQPEEICHLPEFALVDGRDHFDPLSHTTTACSQLLWVRCRHLREALKATDLLVRDGNIPFIMLDLCGLPAASLQSIPASAWWRLKQGCEAVACRLVVLTAIPLVPCASLRLSLTCRISLEDFDRPRPEVLRDLSAAPDLLRRTR